MEIHPLWMGDVVSGMDLQYGDLFIARGSDSNFLCLKAKRSADDIAIVLKEFGAASSAQLPEAMGLAGFVLARPVRKLSGTIVISPVGEDVEDHQVWDYLGNGAIGKTPTCTLISLGDTPPNQRMFDLETGLGVAPPSEDIIWFPRWTLSWQNGEEVRELFRYPPADSVAVA